MYLARQEDGKKIFVAEIEAVIRAEPVVKHTPRAWRFQGIADKSLKTFGVAAIDETAVGARQRVAYFRSVMGE